MVFHAIPMVLFHALEGFPVTQVSSLHEEYSFLILQNMNAGCQYRCCFSGAIYTAFDIVANTHFTIHLYHAVVSQIVNRSQLNFELYLVNHFITGSSHNSGFGSSVQKNEHRQHNWANISETICPTMLVFGK